MVQGMVIAWGSGVGRMCVKAVCKGMCHCKMKAKGKGVCSVRVCQLRQRVPACAALLQARGVCQKARAWYVVCIEPR